jgi:hypothetical protein
LFGNEWIEGYVVAKKSDEQTALEEAIELFRKKRGLEPQGLICNAEFLAKLKEVKLSVEIKSSILPREFYLSPFKLNHQEPTQVLKTVKSSEDDDFETFLSRIKELV